MALKKADLEKIEAKYKITGLVAAHEAATETDVAIPEDVTVLTAAELAQRDANQKAAGKTEGITVGKELVVKDLKTAAGLTYDGEGSKDPARFVTELTKKVEDGAKIEPNAQVTQLKEQVANLQKSVTEKDGQVNNLKAAAESSALDVDIIAAMPANRKGVDAGGMSDKEYLTLIKSQLQTERDEAGALVIKREGQVLRDPTTQNPLNLQTAISGVFTERKWTGEAGDNRSGRGGGSSQGNSGAKPMKLSEATKEWETANPGKGTMSPEFQEHIKGLVKDNKDFDMNA